MLLPGLLTVAVALATCVCEPSLPVRVVDVRPLSEEVHTDGADDVGFASAAGRPPPTRVKRMWGVSDATTRAGRLFVLKIDKDAFHGDVKRFEVSGQTEHHPLPGWLTFDAGRRTFSGVPLEAEVGPHLVTVRAVGRIDSERAIDRFMVDVVHERDSGYDGTPLDAPDESGELSCADGSAVTVASLYFDVAPETLDGATRLRMLHTLAAAVHVNPEVIHVTSHSGGLPIHDDVMEAGAGANQRLMSRSTVFSWKVGCSEQIRPDRLVSVQALRSDQRLAGVSAAAGHPAIGWLLFSRQSAARYRRQVDGSGDGYDFEDMLDEEYFGDPDPTGHVVPSLVTPMFAGPLASAAYPPPRVSAPVHPSRISTRIPLPVVPTIYYPDSLHPSRTIDESPDSPNLRTSYVESSMRLPGGQPQETAHLPGLVFATPTLVVPQVSEPAGAINLPPHLQRRMRKLSLVAGKEFRVRVPAETFSDYETGSDTSRLHLTLKRVTGRELPASEWLQFDAVRQDIYGLPKEEHIGDYQFVLTAQDEQGASASDTLDVVVRMYQQWRATNHRFYLSLTLLKPLDFPITVDWELLLLRKLAKLYGQNRTSSLLVYDIRAMQDRPIKMSWVNDTISTHRCDKQALGRIAARVIGKNGKPTAELVKWLAPEFSADAVRLELMHVCHGVKMASLPTPSTQAPDSNSPPIRRRPVDLIVANVGRLLKFQVPENTFFDAEDRDVRLMQLRLLTSDRQPVPPRNWLWFEPKNQEFIGLPLDKDVGQSYYHLECIDSGGLKVSDSIEVVVKPRDESRQHTVEFAVTLDNDFEQFSRDPMLKQRLMEKLADVMGDSGTDAMLVHDIRTGSVLFSWFNESLPSDACPHAEIRALRERLLDDDGQVAERAAQLLGSDFRLSSAQVELHGVCLAASAPTMTPAPVSEADLLDEHAPESRGDEYLVTFIIPAVVIAVMLLIAGIVACVLFRARRHSKMTMTDNGTYVSRGIPVIFSDELEDRMEKNAKTPVILTNERPPEPPTYPADGAPSPATPMLDAGGEAAGEDVPYERPPPFAGVGDGRAGRAKPVPNYRQPPPYVPP